MLGEPRLESRQRVHRLRPMHTRKPGKRRFAQRSPRGAIVIGRCHQVRPARCGKVDTARLALHRALGLPERTELPLHAGPSMRGAMKISPVSENLPSIGRTPARRLLSGQAPLAPSGAHGPVAKPDGRQGTSMTPGTGRQRPLQTEISSSRLFRANAAAQESALVWARFSAKSLRSYSRANSVCAR